MLPKTAGYRFKTWHAVFAGVVFVLVVTVHLWHNLGSVSLTEVAARPAGELQNVTVTWGDGVYAVKPEQ